MTPSHPSRYPGPKPSHGSRALLAVSPSNTLNFTQVSDVLRKGRVIFSLLVLGIMGTSTRSIAQTTIFSENMGTPTATAVIATYATGTAPATFQNKGVLTYGIGEQTTSDVRTSSASSNSGSSGGGNVFFSAVSGSYGFSIEGINAASYDTLQLSYGYRKSSGSAFAGVSVDYWNGAVWVTIANTSGNLFNEVSTSTAGWYAAKKLSLPAGAQIAGLKLRFVKTGTLELRIDDVKLTGNPVGGDITSPTIASLFPVNGSTELSTNVSITANFDEAVQAGTGAITLKKTSDDSTVPATVTITGSSLSIVPTAALEIGTSYNVQIAAGAVKDLANNNFLGITNATTWTFTTDSTGPTISLFSPLNNAVGIAPPTSISATFNEPVNLPTTSGTSTITIKNSGGTSVATFDPYTFGEGVAVNGSILTLTIPSGTPLEYGSTYYVEIGAGAVTNNSGLPFAGFTGSTIWTFTTVNVPNLSTGAGYSQNFSTFASIATLPLGWSLSGVTATYLGTWGVGTSAGALGGETVFGYQHTSSTGTVLQVLTLRNTSGSPINDLLISYDGRVSRATEARIPTYSVSVAGAPVTALSYSTADGDKTTRTAAVTGLNIADGATFQVQWSSDRGLSSGSSRQIGVSNVSVAIGAQQFAPTVTDTLPLANMSYQSAVFKGEIISDGGSTITARGFVYSETTKTTTPTIGGVGSSTLVDSLTGTEPFTANASGLTPATSYTMRAYATNAIGTSYGSAITFSTLALPPTLVSSYSQAFAAYNGSNPAGWAAVSSGGVQGYAGAWGNGGGTAGFTGGASSPGVLGYQHTGGTVALTTTLTLFNGTGGLLDQLYISYLGRVSRITEGRSPAFTVSVNGSAVPALAYSTLNNVDATVSTTLTGLQIASGASFTISWVSDRGEGFNSSKQIGLGDVLVATSAPTGYEAWKTTDVGGQAADLDYDRDGILNGTEYFMGTAGNAFTSAPGIVSGAVTWPRAAGTTIGSFKVEVSTNLSTWEDASINYAANLDISSSKVAFTLPSNSAKLFVRLSVTP